MLYLLCVFKDDNYTVIITYLIFHFSPLVPLYLRQVPLGLESVPLGLELVPLGLGSVPLGLESVPLGVGVS